MIRPSVFTRAFVALTACFAILGGSSHAQVIGYGVNSLGTLFRFDTDAPAIVTELGPVGFVPEGIDFRPGTSTLYAIDIGPNTTQLYTLDINNGAPTAVGAGFASTGANYNLTGNQSFGFDFNPKTLQMDNSMRIRLVATNNPNLRLNSSTGQIAVVDLNLAFANGNSPFVDAAAYINNIPANMGVTALYDLDSRNDTLLLQSPPNDGVVSTGGSLGAGVDALEGMGFAIYTAPGDADPGIGGDFGYAVIKRPDVPLGGPLGSFLLYDLDLSNGTISNGALVGPAATPYNFDGGFAVIPEPTGLPMIALAIATFVAGRRRSR
ncbi:MAG TPA: DUF4394 domain-containing protein [Pirellulaceae bacterium]